MVSFRKMTSNFKYLTKVGILAGPTTCTRLLRASLSVSSCIAPGLVIRIVCKLNRLTSGSNPLGGEN